MALGICLVAIGISAWSGFSAVNNKDTTIDNSSDIAQISSDTALNQNTSSKNEQAVDTPKDDVPDSRVSSADKEQEKAEQTPVPTAKYFLYPVNGTIIKDFSDTELQYSLTFNDMRLHTAIDIGADINTSVKSAGDGIVTFAGKDSSLGYMVKIDHGNNITAVYAGLSEALKVKEGDTVKAGTALGAIGTVTDECVDAPHLHLAFYEKDVPVSPLSLISEN